MTTREIVHSLRLWRDRDGETTPLGKAAADCIERMDSSLRAVERMLEAGNPLSALEFVQNVNKIE